MNHKRQKQIEQLAKNLLTETNCYTYPPINVHEVARRRGINVVDFEFGDDVSGVLITERDKTTIGVNPNNSGVRQRFTVGHELGHYYLGHQRNGMFVDTPERYFTMFNFRDSNSSTGEFIQEREANAFAAALLMPRELIFQVIDDLKESFNVRSNEDLFEQLAKTFEVSTQAMGFRLSNLNTLW